MAELKFRDLSFEDHGKDTILVRLLHNFSFTIPKADLEKIGEYEPGLYLDVSKSLAPCYTHELVIHYRCG